MAVAGEMAVKVEPEARVAPAEMEPVAPALRAVQVTVGMEEMAEPAATGEMAVMVVAAETAVTVALFTLAIRKTVVRATSMLTQGRVRVVPVIPAAPPE